MANNINLPLLDDRQRNLFSELPEGGTRQRTAAESGRQFVTGDPNLISVSGIKLEEHLKLAGQEAPFIIAKLLAELDWQEFERRYAATGRAPYSPRLMMGLILYGVMRGVHSLRELESMARLDLGCMWVTAGIRPDHTNIGRFIVMHHESLIQEFFESLTRLILKNIGSSSNRLAGDGTVIEAACSHYRLLKEEALRARLERARQQQAKSPDDAGLKTELATLEQCLEVFEQRKAARVYRGKDPESLRISAQEPEAMVQPTKRGRGVCPSYKPSALANEDRIITAFALDASNENKVIGAMLDQSERVVGARAQELLLDAGYFEDNVIDETLARDISMLCPEGRTPEQPKAGRFFQKSAFTFDEQSKTYRCPAGQIMIKIGVCQASCRVTHPKIFPFSPAISRLASSLRGMAPQNAPACHRDRPGYALNGRPRLRSAQIAPVSLSNVQTGFAVMASSVRQPSALLAPVALDSTKLHLPNANFACCLTSALGSRFSLFHTLACVGAKCPELGRYGAQLA